MCISPVPTCVMHHAGAFAASPSRHSMQNIAPTRQSFVEKGTMLAMCSQLTVCTYVCRGGMRQGHSQPALEVFPPLLRGCVS